MKTYSIAIEVAVLIFPIIAFLITLPYMIKQYHRYGSIPFLRTLIIYSFVLYLLTAYFMVILPLPSIKEVSHLTTPWMQLTPFRFVEDLIAASKFVITDFKTYLPALKQPILYTNLFNLLLTVPFGIYLRYYFKRKWWEVLSLSFLLSLFFEVTQLSGLYGIYPRPYRLFDVDDLIINTLGGLLGYIITPLFSFVLPSRKSLDEMAYEKGKRVSFSRRCIAYLIDCVTFNIITIILVLLFGIKLNFAIYSLCFLLYFIVSTILLKGRTIGKIIVKLKIADVSGNNAKIYQLLLRYTFRFVIYYKVFDIINWSMNKSSANSIMSLLAVILCIFSFIIYLKTFIDIITKKEQFVYETISRTKNISTIKYKRNEDIEEEKIDSNDVDEASSDKNPS